MIHTRRRNIATLRRIDFIENGHDDHADALRDGAPSEHVLAADILRQIGEDVEAAGDDFDGAEDGGQEEILVAAAADKLREELGAEVGEGGCCGGVSCARVVKLRPSLIDLPPVPSEVLVSGQIYGGFCCCRGLTLLANKDPHSEHHTLEIDPLKHLSLAEPNRGLRLHLHTRLDFLKLRLRRWGLVCADPLQALPSLVVTPLLDEPANTFFQSEHAEAEECTWDELETDRDLPLGCGGAHISRDAVVDPVAIRVG